MNLRRSKTYDVFKVVNSLLFIALGVVIVAQMAHGVGLRFEAVAGYVLGAALIGLGAVRLRERLTRKP
ncbi:MAG: hypothetical protein M3Z07_04725 [Candidatus Eremiobacteraeota bacterium]|nr:hypothetical protein [Candidatus Eremiobacteraeota bacterium]